MVADQMLTQVYAIARTRAIAETGLGDNEFPAACPYQLDEILSRAFLPD